MKRFAAHRVYRASSAEMLFIPHVVEINDAHEVTACFPFSGEMQQTEWLGGIILITSQCSVQLGFESFDDFIYRFTQAEKNVGKPPFYAFHITAFNVFEMEFTPASRIVRL